MNNVINRNNDRVYNEAFGEKVISFFCLVIAFFENKIVDAVCRMIGGAAVATAIFFYVGAVMGGTVNMIETLILGALLIGASALVFRTKTVRE